MLLPKLLPPDLATASLRRLRPTAAQLTDFKGHLAEMLRHLDPTKVERHGETHILDFLRTVTKPEGGSRYGNVHGKRDLVLHLADTADSPVAVVLEVKGPKNPQEMLAPDDLNRKAFQQLLLYYLEDRSDDRADDFKRLVVTTGYEWYLFDAVDFHRLFWKDKSLVRAFQDWKAGGKASPDTDFFYKNIAGKKLAALEGELRAAYVDLRPGLPTKQGELMSLYRLFHPAYLLKEPLTGRRDPNTLNQEFYNELLYLMGLKEDKAGGVRRIARCPEPERQPGSLLENTLRKLSTGHGLNNLPGAERAPFGDSYDQQLEQVALALCLMWVNRLLFLKLLEGQLVRYHDPALADTFRFLTPARLPEYDEVQVLFFEVLNRPPAERSPDVLADFPQVPYLNSSLFEPSLLEQQTIDISGLRDGLGLAPFPGSVLRKAGAPAVPPAKAHTAAAPQWSALPYLLHFLDAYDFATDPTTSHAPATAHGPADAPRPDAAAPARPLLSAAVLGLVFEKINGYRDGSFYTPGFVTMYMARQTLGRAVVRHFAQAAALPELAGCDSLEELADRLAPARRPDRLRYAAHFNTLTVLDPAVGSGHFLVSALNELLHLKSRLGLFLDEEGGVLPYALDVEHDELVVTDADGLPAPYRVGSFDAATGLRTVGPARTRLQQALFREKRALMEHALFGVDLNPNSVRICRLRLWIELLKHAYYKPETGFRELETLPNLDLNVKTGNSLLARFGLDADLSEVLQKGKFSLKEYRAAVHAYFGSRGRDEKNRLLGFFGQLKEQFTAVLHKKDKKREKLRLYRGQFAALDTQHFLIPETAKQREAREWEMKRLQQYADQLDQEIAAHEQGALFRDAFEWRFEFPEVLDEAGSFRGFDVVIGNPPYIRQEEFAALKPHFKQRFATFDGKADLYVYFIELGMDLLAPGGELSFIAPNRWVKLGYATPMRSWLSTSFELIEFVDFGELYVFPQVKAYPAILSVAKQKPTIVSSFRAAAIPKLPPPSLELMVNTYGRSVAQADLKAEPWALDNAPEQAVLSKMRASGQPLVEYLEKTSGSKIYNGIKTAFNQAFVIDAATRQVLIESEPDAEAFIKPFLAGREVKRYQQPKATSYLLYIDWNFDLPKYPAIEAHLRQFETELKARSEVKAKRYPWYALERPRMEIAKDLGKPKIIIPGLASRAPYAFDKNGLYSNNSTSFIPTDDLFVLGVLNSAAADFYFKSTGQEMKDKFFQYKPKDMSQIPIPAATPAEQAAIAALVQTILDAKAADPAADTRAPEAAVDAAVAALYGVALPGAAAAPPPASAALR